MRFRPETLAAFLTLVVGCAGAASAQGPLPSGVDDERVPFDADAAWRHLEAQVALGPRPSGSSANTKTREYIAGVLEGLGLTPVHEAFDAPTPVGMLSFANVWADLAPRGVPDTERPKTIVLAAHFDTKRLGDAYVGANDGGSGTAVLLELARCLVARDQRPLRYRLLFLDGEEALRSYWAGEDNCYGSRHHVAQLRANGGLEDIAACVLLDMVGDADLKLTTERNSDPELLALFFDAAKKLGLGAHVDGEARELKDDHLRFGEAGVPSVDLIDFEYGRFNEHWHEDTDTLENCSKESLLAIGRIVLAGLPELERRYTKAD